jgi:hypothetical protein
MLMKNSNQGKYGLLMTSLTTQFSMGTNQYPKDVLAAVDILTNHRFDKKEPKYNNQRNRNWNNGNTAITTQSSFNQEALKKATCYCCGKKGHYSNKCPEKDKCSKDEWAVKKAMMHAQAKLEKDSEEKDDNDNTSQVLRRSNMRDKQREWNNLIITKESLHNNSKQWASNTKKDSILLDNGSTEPKNGDRHQGIVNNPGIGNKLVQEQPRKLPTYLDMVWCGMTKPQLRMYLDYLN